MCLKLWKGGIAITHQRAKKKLLLYIDQELTADATVEMTEHLSSCVDCAGARDFLASFSKPQHREQQFSPPPFLWTRLKARIEEYEEPVGSSWNWRMSFQSVPVRLSVALAAILAGVYVGTPSQHRQLTETTLKSQSLAVAREFNLDLFDIIPPETPGRRFISTIHAPK